MKYFLVAGEASGDLHASHLMRSIQACDADAQFRFFGGDAMAEVSPGCVCHIRHLAIMGFWEVLTHLRRIRRNLQLCKRTIEEFSPDAVILVDFPGFNLRVARHCKRLGLRTFYYIAPKVWAWKESRVKQIRAYVDHLLPILPFEPSYFLQRGIETVYEGNPLLDELPLGSCASGSDSEFRRIHGLDDRPIIALLPGSREQELRYIFGVMSALTERFPDYQFVVAAAANLPYSLYEGYMSQHSGLSVVHGATHQLLLRSSAAVVTSGTATLETALLRVPQVVVYRGNALSIWLARRFVRVEWISLVNLILQRGAVSELIQEEYNADRLSSELARVLPGGVGREELLASYDALRVQVGDPGVSMRLAGRIVGLVRGG